MNSVRQQPIYKDPKRDKDRSSRKPKTNDPRNPHHNFYPKDIKITSTGHIAAM